MQKMVSNTNRIRVCMCVSVFCSIEKTVVLSPKYHDKQNASTLHRTFHGHEFVFLVLFFVFDFSYKMQIFSCFFLNEHVEGVKRVKPYQYMLILRMNKSHVRFFL